MQKLVQEQEPALTALQKSFGNSKGKKRKPFTAEAKEAIAEELVKNLGRQKEVFKRAGL